MNWFYTLVTIFAVISIAINIYILVFEIQERFKWTFLLSTSLGIFFGFFRLYTIYGMKN
jgi:hypothetical protein